MTKHVRAIGIAAVFLVGCAVGGASARFVVPPANAQQHATLTKWEYFCINEVHAENITPKANQLGAQYWELVAAAGPPRSELWCFKRPALGGYAPLSDSTNPITVSSRRLSLARLQRERPHAVIIDVTSKGELPWQRGTHSPEALQPWPMTHC